MKSTLQKITMVLPAALLMASVSAPAANAEIKASYLYSLSDFYGLVPYSWTRVVLDNWNAETYVLFQNNVKVFNGNGMEVYEFGDDIDVGIIYDVAIDEKTNIFLLTNNKQKYSIVRCNYRGEPKQTIEIKGLPDELKGFIPFRMVYRKGNFYLASLGSMQIAVVDRNGNCLASYNIKPMLELSEEEKKKGNEMDMVGFNVDNDGNMLFTIPAIFKVFRLTPDRKISSFGQPGSIPGKFGIVSGVAEDNRGNYLVVDKLKSVVMVFDKDYTFITEFGHRGVNPDNFIVPDEIAIDKGDKIYVTQTRNRGVSVFRLAYE
ncbi:MAG: 6-bladed beta-propeller [Nitrospiraceae bacterium]|nr:6-bladed beta-propeller [Nitrospiraceae bacterium]